MALTGLDIIVLIVIGGAAVLGFIRGFTTEILALAVWLVLVLAIKLLHTPLAAILAGIVGTAQGAAVLSFAIIAGVTYFGGRIVANLVGTRTRQSFLGPIDRALGFGFGGLKGLVLVSIAFLLIVLVVDTVSGGPSRRPEWIRESKSYPMLDATSAFVADFVDRRRKGEPVFGEDDAERLTNSSRED